VLSATGSSPVAGTLELTGAQLVELKEGRAYVAFPSADVPDGYLRGQVLPPGEELWAVKLEPVPGFPHPGSGGNQMLLNRTTFTYRQEARWTGDVVATAAHLHRPDGGVVQAFTRTPDAGGARGTYPLLPLVECLSVGCYSDVHTADGGVVGAPADAGGVLLMGL
jgi:hypothetical protein